MTIRFATVFGPTTFAAAPQAAQTTEVRTTGQAHRPEALNGRWNRRDSNSYYVFETEGNRFSGAFMSGRGIPATEIEGEYNREKDLWEGKFHIVEPGNCNELPWHGELVLNMDRSEKRINATTYVYELDREKCQLTGRKDEFHFELVRAK